MLSLQEEIRFIYNGIKSYHGDAQIIKHISLLIPRDTKDSNIIPYKVIHYGIRASDIDCGTADISIDELSLKLRLS